MTALPDVPANGFVAGTENPSAALIIVHGLAEYADRYRDVAAALSAAGISCFAFDLRDHGHLPARRPHVERFQVYVDDFRQVVRAVRTAHPQLPLFLWGHSMGSLIAAFAVAESPHDIRGVITSGLPVDAFKSGLHPFNPVGRWLARRWPRLRLPLFLKGERISSVASVQRAYDTDERIAHWASVRLLVELAQACDRCVTLAPTLGLPWLVAHGDEDVIAPIAGAQRFHELLGSSDKALTVYRGARHEVHNEKPGDRTAFLAMMIEWIRERS